MTADSAAFSSIQQHSPSERAGQPRLGSGAAERGFSSTRSFSHKTCFSGVSERLLKAWIALTNTRDALVPIQMCIVAVHSSR